MRVIICAHVVWDKGFENNGPAHIVARYIDRKGISYAFLKFPLSDNHEAVIKDFDGKSYPVAQILPRFKYLTDVLTTIRWVRTLKDKNIIFVGVDPLNALSGLILKRLGKIKVFVFHTPDYSPVKFKDPLLNFFYHAIDRLCAKRADFVWGVSQRITEKRKSQRVDATRLFWVPNSPPKPFVSDKKLTNRTLVVLANLSNALSFAPTFEALKGLKDINLLLIGSGKMKADVKSLAKELGVFEKIEFTGWLPYEKAIERTKKCGIGIAFYSNEASWTKYCDPVKVRDYLACGLPVVMNDIPAVSEEIKEYGAGKVVDNKSEEIAKAVETIYESDDKYNEFSRKALVLAKERSSEKTLDAAFEAIRAYIKDSP